jgi:fatty-acyl-CoA synthase
MADVRTLPDALDFAARSEQGYTFLSGGGETFRSYADIRTAALRVARSLREAGLARGDLVAIVLADAEPFLTTLFGASMAGVVPASLHPPPATSDLQRYLDLTAEVLRASCAKAVVTSAALAPGFDALRARCPDLALVLDCGRLDAPELASGSRPAPDDIAFVQFTSGSTATPKGVAVTHRSLGANIDAFNGPSGVMTSARDSAVSWLPLNHDMGLVGMALGPLYSARPCVLMPAQAFVKRPADWLRAISRFRATISFAPNFAYELCVRRVKDRDLDEIDLSSWRVAGCGAEPVHAATLAAFAEKFETAGFRASGFLPSYGLAEHVLAATFPPCGRPPRTEHVSAAELTKQRVAVTANGGGAVTLVSCGFPLPQHRLQIVDDEGRAVPERHVGEILLAGPSLMAGYYKHDALTEETMHGGWLRTGDLGYLSNGELFVCGRAKDLIIVNGRKYHPQDLEWAAGDVPGVRRGRVVAFGIAEPGRADRVVLVVEPAGTCAANEIAAAVRRRISDVFGLAVDDVALVPGGTVRRTANGKVQRAATRAQYERGAL